MVCDEQLRGLPYGKARVAYVFLVYWVTREYLVYMGWQGQYLAFSGPVRSGNFHPARPGLDKFADDTALDSAMRGTLIKCILHL